MRNEPPTRPSGTLSLKGRGQQRRDGVLRLLATIALPSLATVAHAESFPDFLHAFAPTAVASGVSPAVYELSTAGLTPDPTIKNLVETQPEFTTPIWTYLDQRVTESRIKNGKAALDNPKLIKPIVRSLATLVWQHRGRYEGDKADFIAALKLVQRGPLDAKHLVGSWAGAIGHLQVNPGNVIIHGTDGDGDGKVDLKDSLPDALAFCV